MESFATSIELQTTPLSPPPLPDRNWLGAAVEIDTSGTIPNPQPSEQQVANSSHEQVAAGGRTPFGIGSSLSADQSGDQPQRSSSACTRAYSIIKRLRAWIGKSYFKSKGLNTSVSQLSLRYYPQELQWDLELSYLLLLSFFLFIVPHDGFLGSLAVDPRSMWKPTKILERLHEMFLHAGFEL